MWSAVVTATPPSVEPMSVSDARLHCRIDSSDDDAVLARLISAARGHIESMTATRLVEQTVTLRTDDWNDLAHLPVAPVQAITSIGYVDANGDAQTLSTDVYEPRLFGLEPGIALKHGQQWPSPRFGSLVTVTAVAGYGNAASVPPAIVSALAMMVHDMNEHRGADGVSPEVMTAADGLLQNYKLHLVA